MDSNLKGIFIPIEILSDSNLSLQEKLILSLVKIMPSGLYMSNSNIGDLINLSKSRVSEICSSLAEKGYIDVKLHYKGKQVIKRTITIKQAINNAKQAVKQVVDKVVGKAKQLKQEYTTTQMTVGTQQVEQVTFAYKKQNTKHNKFTDGYSHNFDFAEIERLERERNLRLAEQIRNGGVRYEED